MPRSDFALPSLFFTPEEEAELDRHMGFSVASAYRHPDPQMRDWDLRLITVPSKLYRTATKQVWLYTPKPGAV